MFNISKKSSKWNHPQNCSLFHTCLNESSARRRVSSSLDEEVISARLNSVWPFRGAPTKCLSHNIHLLVMSACHYASSHNGHWGHIWKCTVGKKSQANATRKASNKVRPQTAKLFSPFHPLSRISIQMDKILQELYYETFNSKVWSLRGLFVELPDAKGWLWFKWVSWSVAKHFRAPLSTIFASPPSIWSSSSFSASASASAVF